MTMVADINTLRGGGVLVAILGGECPPFLQILTLFRSKNVIFPHPFSDLASKIQTHMAGNFMSSLLRLERQYFEIHFRLCKLLFLSFFLIHLELKRQMRSHTPSRSSLGPYPIVDQNGQNL